MVKVDFKKTLTSYSAPHGSYEILQIPTLQYLMVDGHGDPNTDASFNNAISLLYPVAYKLKFISKIELGKDYVVPPLEGLWWAENMEHFTAKRDKSKWSWTLMLMVPDWLQPNMLDKAKQKLSVKKPDISFEDVRLETLDEDLCVQTMHIGSFDDEGPVLQKMHDEFIPENGYIMTGKHHEVYLSDFRKVAPKKLKTILRQPVKRAQAVTPA